MHAIGFGFASLAQIRPNTGQIGTGLERTDIAAVAAFRRGRPSRPGKRTLIDIAAQLSDGVPFAFVDCRAAE